MGRGQGNVQMGGAGGAAPMTPSALEKRLQRNTTGSGITAEQLSQAEQDIIADYIGKVGEKKYNVTAEQLNRGLYDPAWLAQQPQQLQRSIKAQAAELDSALAKLKNYEGEVYRLLDDPVGPRVLGHNEVVLGPGLHNMGSRAAALEPGSITTLRAPTSASRVRNAVNFNYRAPLQTSYGVTRVRITSKTAKAIEKVGEQVTEREVLFRANTSFKVKSRKWNRRTRTWDVHLVEI